MKRLCDLLRGGATLELTYSPSLRCYRCKVHDTVLLYYVTYEETPDEAIKALYEKMSMLT